MYSVKVPHPVDEALNWR